ncbi:hypothetical protein [Kordia sp.]|uniref:hypothetical protein n=1 Tax=Kordia sp. TaxID=1965332 RepID=UPI003B5AF809
MCRYAFKTYKPHYVCFDCRKTFKQPIVEDIVMQNGDWDSYKLVYINYDSEKSRKFRADNPEVINRFEKQYRNKKYKCPDCSSEMNTIGLDFKAPKKDKIKEWNIIKSMYTLGNTFHTCGCNGPGFIPKKSVDYLTYLEKIKVEYETRLNVRDKEFSESELNEYLNYWSSKLKSITKEIEKINNNFVIPTS